MIKKIIVISVLLLAARQSAAVVIDLPGYSFAGIATTASLAPSAAGAYTSNHLSASEDITDANATTYIFSNEANARVNLDFSVDVYNGDGFDLSIFFVGGGVQGHSFGLSLPDNPTTFPNAIVFDSTTYPHYSHTGFNLTGSNYPIYRMDIDLNEYGLLGNSPIGILSLDIGNSSAVPSLVGAHHLQPAAVVPLPLPALLFSSGLALLGFIGRRSRR